MSNRSLGERTVLHQKESAHDCKFMLRRRKADKALLFCLSVFYNPNFNWQPCPHHKIEIK